MTNAELLAPAGDFETALAAFAAGADAVYCGLADFSARAFAKNFTMEDLSSLMRYARGKDKRVYVTFNTLLDEDQLEGALETLAELEEIGPDAVIVQDLGIARMCRKHFPKLALHASTQLVAHNLEGVLALRELGFTRVVLARELSLDEITSISRRCGDVELECFIHGALCYSISGLCLFSALEKGRSGNRGQCAYCCRQSIDGAYPFSMKDLRLGGDVRKLVDAGVVSLKIEGRMKSPLYVASVTRYYRDILDGRDSAHVTVGDLETVFSRRTTELYLNGRPDQVASPLDATSLGHVGTPIGTVKKVTKDREGRRWLRFHTSRALEKHDGLQFDAMVDGRHLGMGIVEMRQAISRQNVFEVSAGTDVEILLPEGETDWSQLKPNMRVFCSMSNAVKRLFPAPSFRASEYLGTTALDVTVTLDAAQVTARATYAGETVCVSQKGAFDAAKSPEKTFGAIEKAFQKFGGTDYRLGRLVVSDTAQRFVPMSVLNDVRRDLVERVDDMRHRVRHQKVASALAELAQLPAATSVVTPARRTLKVRVGQKVPAGTWDEIVVALELDAEVASVQELDAARVRLALPLYTPEPNFNRLRTTVKRFLRAGYSRWEASDLATLRLLKALGVTDISADWSLYAFNSAALAACTELGIARFVASPENGRENLQYLVESGYDVECLAQQSTPLFISLTQPAEQTAFAVFRRNDLWVTTKGVPRTFAVPEGASTRIDLSWDPQ